MDNLGIPNQSIEKEAKGPIIGIVVIIILLILGGVYLWQSNTFAPAEQTVVSDDPMTQDLATQSTSTALEDIDADVSNTNLNNIDQELGQIGSELGQ